MKNLIERTSSILFFVLIILIPVQLGKHFWPEFSSVLGIRIDFLAPTIYFTDILIFLFVLTSVLGGFYKRSPSKKLILASFIFLFSQVLSVLTSANKLLSLWFLLKIFEFVSLTIAVSLLDFKKNYSKIGLLFTTGAVFSVVLATFQFATQESAGLWILGERSFNILTPGIARLEFGGELFLRPYATFPHPNVLAGYLAIALILFLFTQGQFFEKKTAFVNFLKIPILAILVAGVILTFSRSAWVSLVIAGFFTVFAQLKNVKFFKIVTATILLVLALIFIFPQNLVSERFWQITTTDKHSLVLRTKLANAAFKMFTENPTTGVGLGNFLPSLPRFWKYEEDIRFLQPVHNIFLLILAESGILGILAFGFLLLTTFLQLLKSDKIKANLLLPVWLVILIILVFDHYFWTLQQGQILFFLMLGLSWADFDSKQKL